MIRRRQLEPSLAGEGEISLGEVVAHLRQWQADTVATVDSLRESRQQIEEQAARLEDPQAAVALVEFFAGFLVGVAAELNLVLANLASGPRHEDAQTLRRLAAGAAAEEQRAVRFRDRSLNKPLPYEDMRPVLDRLSAAVRDQLTDYRSLTQAASRLETLANRPAATPAPPAGGSAAEAKGFDRRALFMRFMPKDDPDPKPKPKP
jgi:hypothetical protein